MSSKFGILCYGGCKIISKHTLHCHLLAGCVPQGAAIGVCWVGASVTAISTASWLMSRYGWQYPVALAALPALLAALMSLAAPESPMWLVAKGRHKEAEGTSFSLL
jgi:MFS family permease